MIAWCDHVNDIHIFIEKESELVNRILGDFYTLDYKKKTLEVIFENDKKVEYIDFGLTDKIKLILPDQYLQNCIQNGVSGDRSGSLLNPTRYGIVLIDLNNCEQNFKFSYDLLKAVLRNKYPN